MENVGGYGNFIIIDHGGFLSAYAHLMDRQVQVGDEVKKGEQIALSGGGQGKSKGGGMSTGPHLHFEIRKNKKFQDRFKFLGVTDEGRKLCIIFQLKNKGIVRIITGWENYK